MMGQSDYTITVTVDGTFDAVQERVLAALAEQGFGVLTEIDVTATLKQRLDLEFGRRYKILGACNPPFAHQALQADLSIGVLLPCNVIVYETDQGQVRVEAINPMAMTGMAAIPALESIADEVGKRLQAALDAV